MHAPGEEKRSVVPIEQPDWLVWLAPEHHEELRGLLKLFDAELYETSPKPKVPRKLALKE